MYQINTILPIINTKLHIFFLEPSQEVIQNLQSCETKCYPTRFDIKIRLHERHKLEFLTTWTLPERGNSVCILNHQAEQWVASKTCICFVGLISENTWEQALEAVLTWTSGRQVQKDELTAKAQFQQLFPWKLMLHWLLCLHPFKHIICQSAELNEPLRTLS